MNRTESTGRLAELMGRMARGDAAAVFALIDEHGDDLAAVVRRHLRSWGRHDLVRRDDEVDHMVQTAAQVLLDRAASWRPGGAPPWVWADLAIRHALARDLGHPTVGLDPERHEPPAVQVPRAGGRDLDLGSLARRHPGFRRFRATLAAVTSPRDRAVVEGYLVQQALGDPSPALTVATHTGLSPVNVRQIVCRARRRVRERLGTDEPGLLGNAGWLAA
jgi:DNA-directed RNA polymerase specialized sigma24 family protein